MLVVKAFGGHVGGGSRRPRLVFAPQFLAETGNAKIRNFDPPGPRGDHQQNVFWLDVTVNDALAMGVIEGI